MKEPRGWHKVRCGSCGGYGVVSTYTFGGDDFLGPGERESCGGSGLIWISPKGRIADYPGGSFRGSYGRIGSRGGGRA